MRSADPSALEIVASSNLIELTHPHFFNILSETFSRLGASLKTRRWVSSYAAVCCYNYQKQRARNFLKTFVNATP